MPLVSCLEGFSCMENLGYFACYHLYIQAGCPRGNLYIVFQAATRAINVRSTLAAIRCNMSSANLTNAQFAIDSLAESKRVIVTIL